MESITEHLLARPRHNPRVLATETHPFLTSAAEGTLSESLLALWLYQDRIYAAQAYPRFIGSLIAHLPLDNPTSNSDEALLRRVLRTLTFCLENIVREVEFFDNTAKR
jgi:thiaminase